MAHSPICSVDGCGKRRALPGECQQFFKSVVLTHDSDECLLWPFSCDTFGYGQLYWDGRVRRVHAVVCSIFNGPRPSPKHEAAHSCGKGHAGCVNKHHLRWDTRLGNQSDRKSHGTHITGERHGRSTLTEDQVREIKSLRGAEPLSRIASRYGVSKQQISAIHTGKNWGWLK